MKTVHQEQGRKYELLDSYRASRTEEFVEELRREAVEEAKQDRFPWKGAFRTREEILGLYRMRRRWERRFVFDTAIAVLLLGCMIYFSPRLMKVGFLPGPVERRSAKKQAQLERPGAPAAADQLEDQRELDTGD